MRGERGWGVGLRPAFYAGEECLGDGGAVGLGVKERGEEDDVAGGDGEGGGDGDGAVAASEDLSVVAKVRGGLIYRHAVGEAGREGFDERREGVAGRGELGAWHAEAG